MIRVTRLNGKDFFLNPFLIETMEENPDTVIVLNSGKKLIVKEKIEEVKKQFSDFLGDVVSAGIKRAKR